MVMTRIILILLLTVVSGSLHADWVNFGTSVTRTGNVTAYVNQTTIQKTGEKSKMWILYDSRIPRKFEKLAYKSSMGQDEYDCKTKQSRTIAILLYSKNLGHGDVVSKFSTSSSNWESAPPDSMSGHLLEYACGMK
jgi:hypothetical protein